MKAEKVKLFSRWRLARKLMIFGLLPVIAAAVFCSTATAAQEKYMAVTLTVDPYLPGAVTALSAESGNNTGEVSLKWLAPSDDGTHSAERLPDGAYNIRYGRQPLSDFADAEDWWNNAVFDGVFTDINWLPNFPGTADTKTIGGLLQKVTYYFAVKAKDKVGNWSEVSNVAAAPAQWERIAPMAVTDLAASPYITEGTIKLTWTAPSEDGTAGAAVSNYIIRYATFGVSGLGGNATVWWNLAVGKSILTSPAAPGTEETQIISGLASGVYYFAIKSVDDVGNYSLIDENAVSLNQAKAPAQAIPPAAINDLTVKTDYNKVLLAWTAPGDDGWAGQAARYVIKYATYSIDVGNFDEVSGRIEINVSVPGGSADSYVLTGLAGDTLYYIAVKTFDDVDNASNISNIVSTKTLDNVAPAVPSGFSGTGTDHRVDLAWSGNSEYDFAGYNLYRSTFSMGYSTTPLARITATFYADTGLENGVTQYYVLTSVDLKDNESAYSAEVVAMPHDTLAPRAPAGIKGILSPDGRTMSISWSSVTRNSDGTDIDDLAGYCVYKAPSLDEIYVLKDFVPAGGALTWTDPDNVKGHVFYYLIRAQDKSYNRSAMSMIVDCSADTNVIGADEADMSTYISVPKKVSEVLYAATNSYGDDIRIKVTRNPSSETGRVIRSYTFAAEKGRTKEAVNNLSFKKAETEIILSYNVENGYVKTASQIPENEAPNRLAIFGFNGNEWIKLGGEVDAQAHTIKLKTKRLGKFMIKNSLRATSFSIMAIQPDKIFTPNGDGWNDYFEIICANPNDGMVSGKIYDINGRFVKGMEKGGSSSSADVSLKWDGRDASGADCPGGVYLYQVEITGPENKVINGTCVIAK